MKKEKSKEEIEHGIKWNKIYDMKKFDKFLRRTGIEGKINAEKNTQLNSEGSKKY